jgi:low temperature requirement protein LtrA
MAAGVMLTIGHAAQPYPLGQAITLSGGVALFLAGDAWFRATLRIGSPWPRLATAVFALAATALGVSVAVEAQLAVLLGALVAMLAAERYAAPTGGLGPLGHSRLRRRRAGGWNT